MSQQEALGPVELAVIGFPGSQFSGEIAPVVADLVESGTVSRSPAYWHGVVSTSSGSILRRHRWRSPGASPALTPRRTRPCHVATSAAGRRGDDDRQRGPGLPQ